MPPTPRYATLVDPLMPQVTACLRDPCLQVRHTTLTLLINLLQEDYLKLKGSFFYRILQVVCHKQHCFYPFISSLFLS